MNDLTPGNTVPFNPAEGFSEPELHMMDQFANQYAFGQPLSVATRAAGYGTSNLSKGFELLQIPYVQARVDAIREWIKQRLTDDLNTLLMQLDQDRAFAYQQYNPSAAVAATNSKAKLLGLLDPDKDKKVPAKITIEWASDTGDIVDVKDVTNGAHPLNS